MALIPLSGKLGSGLVAIVDDEDHGWLSRWRWHLQSKGYARVTIYPGAKALLMHQAIARPGKGQVVDHVNGNKLDNRRENLRVCWHFQNDQNRKMHTKRAATASRFKGVYRTRSRWQASIKIHGKKVCLGTFADQVEAAIAYNMAAAELFGEFASFNRNLLMETVQ